MSTAAAGPMEARLQNVLKKAVAQFLSGKDAALPDDLEYEIQATKDASHGDFASNIAFRLARIARSKPLDIAKELIQILQSEALREDVSFIEKVEAAGGGFLNFFLSEGSLAEILLIVHREDRKYGESRHGQDRKIVLEFVSANPTGPLTIAHGRQAAVGDSLYRILKTVGYKPSREFYLNDGGRQIRLLGASVWARYCEEFQIEASFPEDGYRGEYIRDIARELVKKHRDNLLKEEEEKAVALCSDFAQAAMMAGIQDELARFGVKFENYFSEKSLYDKNQVEEALDFLRQKDFLYEEEGALWFRSMDFGDDKNRVVRKSTGEYTYLAPDIAYHRTKFDRGYDRLINLWGPDHHGYIARLKAACQALGHPGDDIEIRIVQLTTLYRGGQPVRMSTRAGEFVTLKELMDEVGVDATRFFFILRRVESPLDFDLDLAKAQSQENPVYYLQYAHARTASLLKFAERAVTTQVNLQLLQSPEETEVMKTISEFPKYLIQASDLLEPYRLADYLRDLAASFHRFYQKHRVVTEDEELTKARLLLVNAVRIVLRNGLDLLGISQPESM